VKEKKGAVTARSSAEKKNCHTGPERPSREERAEKKKKDGRPEKWGPPSPFENKDRLWNVKTNEKREIHREHPCDEKKGPMDTHKVTSHTRAKKGTATKKFGGEEKGKGPRADTRKKKKGRRGPPKKKRSPEVEKKNSLHWGRKTSFALGRKKKGHRRL